MTGNRTVRIMAFVPIIMRLFCRVYAGNDVCSGSKYRFCGTQNRRTCRRASVSGSREEVAK